jgi:hypothetical protein
VVTLQSWPLVGISIHHQLQKLSSGEDDVDANHPHLIDLDEAPVIQAPVGVNGLEDQQATALKLKKSFG